MQDNAAIYNKALELYNARNFADAEQLFRQSLTINPHHAQSLHMMAAVNFSTQRYDAAEEFMRMTLAEEQNNADFYFTMARILNKRDKKAEAAENYKKVLALNPDSTDAMNNLGIILMSLGQMDGASDIFKRLLAKNPDNFYALCNTASISYDQQKYEEALKYYQHALKQNSTSASLNYDLGRTLKSLNRFEEALMSFQKAHQLDSNHVDALLEMGRICMMQGVQFRNSNMLTAALHYFFCAVALRPEETTYSNIGYIYEQGYNYREAIKISLVCLEHFPNSAKSYDHIGSFHCYLMEYEQALDYYHKALAIDPNNGQTYANMGSALKNIGRVDEAIAAFKKALVLSPDKPWIYSNLLLTMVYAASVTPEELAEYSRQFGERVADAFRRKRPFANNKNPRRKLRIGYVSPDFCNHPVNYFLAPIHKRDKENFEVFAYSKVEVEDDVTAALKKEFDHWRDIKTFNEDAAADLIEADKIDILVDLAGHTARNGLMIFARKPAPIQVTWLGHPATTGMKTMDYRITDFYAEPPGMTEHLNTETLWRLPQIFCAYEPHENSPAVIDHPPFEDNGYVTFGCFNNFTKVTDPVLETWAKIMEKVPTSRLLLEITGIESEKIRTEIENRLIGCGLLMDRVKLEPRKKENKYVLYNKIDIALDPFPCVGGTTSMDTLWMGTPLVTLAGAHFASRMGVTIVSNAGLAEIVAQNIDDYISIAVGLAQNHDKLRDIRQNLRERVAASPLMDQESFTRHMETAYRQMWQKWTDKNAK